MNHEYNSSLNLYSPQPSLTQFHSLRCNKVMEGKTLEIGVLGPVMSQEIQLLTHPPKSSFSGTLETMHTGSIHTVGIRESCKSQWLHFELCLLSTTSVSLTWKRQRGPVYKQQLSLLCLPTVRHAVVLTEIPSGEKKKNPIKTIVRKY